MPIVQLPDGRQVEFPDTMSQEEILGVMREKFPSEEVQKPSFMENIWGRGAVDTPGEKLGEAIQQGGRGLVSGAAGLADFFTAPARSLYGRITGEGPVGLEALRGPASALVEPVTAPQPQSRLGEYARTAGEFVPGAAAFGGTSPTNLLRFGIVPGVASETAGQLTEGVTVAGQDVEPYARIAAALAAPAALPRAVTPNVASGPTRQAAQALKREGVRLTAGQKTGSPIVQYREGLTEAGRRLTEQSADDFTKAALSRIGADSTRWTPEVFNSAFKRIGGVFDDFAARNPVDVDQRLIDDIDDIVTTYQQTVGTAAKLPSAIADDIYSAARAGQPISGARYNEFNSRLGKLTKSADPTLREVAIDLKNAVGSAMERSAQAAGRMDDVAMIQDARSQWRDLLTLERAASAAGSRTGTITPAALDQSVKAIAGKRAYVTGRNDLGELSRQGAVAFERPFGAEAIVREQSLKDIAIPGLLAGGGATAIGGPAAGGVVGPIAAALGPRAKNVVATSGLGQSYLGNQLMAGQKTADPRLMAAIIAALQSNQGAQ